MYLQIDKKEKPELGPEAEAGSDGGARQLSRREEKAPAREQPTTGEAPSSAPGYEGAGVGSISLGEEALPSGNGAEADTTVEAPAPSSSVAGDSAEPDVAEPETPTSDSNSKGILSRFTENFGSAKKE